MQDLTAARNQRRRELRQKLTERRSLTELLTQPAARQPESSASAKDDQQVSAPRGRRLKLYRED